MYESIASIVKPKPDDERPNRVLHMIGEGLRRVDAVVNALVVPIVIVMSSVVIVVDAKGGVRVPEGNLGRQVRQAGDCTIALQGYLLVFIWLPKYSQS